MTNEGTLATVLELRGVTPTACEQCAPGFLPAAQVRFAQEIQEDYHRSLGSVLSAYLEAPITIASREPRQLPAEEVLKSAGDDVWFLSFAAECTESPVLLALPGGLLRRALGILISLPTDVAPEGKPVTEIELHVLREFGDLIVQELVRSWAGNNLDLKASSWPPLPSADFAAGGDSVLLVLESTMRFGEKEEAFLLAVPVMLVRIAAAEIGAVRGATGVSHDERLDALAGAVVQVEAILEGAPIRMKDLLTLHGDQVLKVSRPVGSPFLCLLNGKPTFVGEMTSAGLRQAFQIESVIPAGLERLPQSE
jgi:flagellar motor switch protein FliM